MEKLNDGLYDDTAAAQRLLLLYALLANNGGGFMPGANQPVIPPALFRRYFWL